MSDEVKNKTGAVEENASAPSQDDIASQMIIQKPKNFKASIGKLIRFLKPWTPAILLSALIVATATVVAILSPNMVKDLTTVIMEGAVMKGMGLGGVDLTEVGRIGLTLAFMYGGVFLFNYIQNFIMAGVTTKSTRALRTKLSVKINKIPLKYYDRHAVGDVMSRVSNDIDTIGETLNQSFSSMIRSIIMLVGVLIAMFVTQWQMALAAVATVPISAVLIVVIVKISQKYHREKAKQLGVLNGIIEENYSAQSIVKAFNGQAKSEKEFTAVNDKLAKATTQSSFLSMGVMMPIMSFVSNLGFVAICVVGGILISNAAPAEKAGLFGTVAAFLIYLRLFQSPMSEIAQSMGNLQSTAAASERVFEFLETEEQEDESNKPKFSGKVAGAVEFKNVRFGYNEDKIIIKNFSAGVKPGQKIAIVGPTGAGKTTLINLLMRFYEINGGEILIDGVSTREMRRPDVRGMFGMVLQDSWLFEGTVRENIVYAKEGVSEEEVVKAAKAAGIDHYIRTLPDGYDTLFSDDVNISSGQRQLITIARAMVQNAPMLILDEATSNVDTRTEQLIQDAMDKITKGRTSFVIAHRLSTIKNADLILVIKEGDIAESGTHDELLAQNGFYAELYNSQFESCKD